jgi:glycosyltransferase involved in cell wall biosynthesis
MNTTAPGETSLSQNAPSLGRICIWQPGETTGSETFLNVHAKGLPGEVTVVFGGRSPVLAAFRKPLLAPITRAFVAARRFLPPAAQQRLDARKSAEIAAFLRRNRFQVVLAQFGSAGVEVLAAVRQAGVPLVVHFHGRDAHAGSAQERRDSYRELFQSAAGVVAVSRFMQSTLIELGCPPEKISCVPCGADDSVIQPADPASNPPHLLAVGRMVDKKAPHLTVLAFSYALQSCPDAVLHMVGDGPLLAAAMQLAQALGIADRVRFHGAQPQQRVVELMQQVRVFVQHSVQAPDGDCEGTPVAVVEALTAGVPVVVTRHAGIADVVTHGATGFLVDEYDVAAMASHITALLMDPPRVRQLSAAARRHALEHLTARTRLRELAAAIGHSIQRPARS